MLMCLPGVNVLYVSKSLATEKITLRLSVCNAPAWTALVVSAKIENKKISFPTVALILELGLSFIAIAD